MSENFEDYDIEISIRCIAGELGIEPAESPKKLFAEIEARCPDAAVIMLEHVFIKDQLKNYLAESSDVVKENGNMIVEGDPMLEEYWNKLESLYPHLTEAVNNCKG